MKISPNAVTAQADELLTMLGAADAQDIGKLNQAFQGALTLLRVVHGADSAQESQLRQAMNSAEKLKDGAWFYRLQQVVRPAVVGTLEALKSDVAKGLTGNVALQVSGELLGDLLSLAKVALADGGEGQKNVAAVLVAAAFEDTLRRLAAAKAGVVDRPKLEEIVGRLKVAAVLVGASVATAAGYLKFRNDALHADWNSVSAATVSSCLAFVEAVLLEHFS